MSAPKYCSECGAALPVGARFCPECSHEVVVAASADATGVEPFSRDALGDSEAPAARRRSDAEKRYRRVDEHSGEDVVGSSEVARTLTAKRVVIGLLVWPVGVWWLLRSRGLFRRLAAATAVGFVWLAVGFVWLVLLLVLIIPDAPTSDDGGDETVVSAASATSAPSPAGASAPVATRTAAPSTPKPTATPDEMEDWEACQAAERLVESKLKSPASRDWVGNCYTGSNYSLTSKRVDGFLIWTVIGQVDSQNGFGALIRSTFIVEVTDLGTRYRAEILAFE